MLAKLITLEQNVMLYYMLLSLSNGLKRSSYHQWGVGERLWVEKGWNRCHWGSIAKCGVSSIAENRSIATPSKHCRAVWKHCEAIRSIVKELEALQSMKQRQLRCGETVWPPYEFETSKLQSLKL